MSKRLEDYTFEYLLEKGLSVVDNSFDKREGTPIFDAASSMAIIAMSVIDEIKNVYKCTFAKTAEGEELSMRAKEAGIIRRPSSSAIKKGIFISEADTPYILPLGAKFSTVGANPLIFEVIEEIIGGTYLMKCKEAGEAGNTYTGELLPVEVRVNLKSATLTDLVVPGEKEENDEELRERYYEEKPLKNFGGNIEQYRDLITKQDGVGSCQVYPLHEGSGTVKISFIDSRCMPASSDFVSKMQNLIDPQKDGGGIGIAPIDHVVTVTTATKKIVAISAKLKLANGYSLSQLRPFVNEELERYFENIRKGWGKPVSADRNVYSSDIFRSQVIASILKVAGVLDVQTLKLNNEDKDVVLQETAILQELPILGVVSLE